MGLNVAGKFKIDFKQIPWYLIIPDFAILITSPTIPVSISDKKKIIYADTPIPGRNTNIKYGIRGEGRIISFTLPIINRISSLGNANYLAPFEILRNADNPELLSLFQGDIKLFKEYPKVYYSWGTNSIPMEYFVISCDFDHNSTLTNKLGMSQYTDVSLTLELNEDSSLYRAEKILRVVKARAGMVENAINIRKSGRPY